MPVQRAFAYRHTTQRSLPRLFWQNVRLRAALAPPTRADALHAAWQPPRCMAFAGVLYARSASACRGVACTRLRLTPFAVFARNMANIFRCIAYSCPCAPHYAGDILRSSMACRRTNHSRRQQLLYMAGAVWRICCAHAALRHFPLVPARPLIRVRSAACAAPQPAARRVRAGANCFTRTHL